jgi:acyl carrier protein
LDTTAEVLAILRKKMKPEVPANADTKLTALEIDSLDLVEIMFELEDKFGIQLPQNSEAMQDATVRDLLAWVEQEIGKKAGASAGTQAAQAPGAGS